MACACNPSYAQGVHRRIQSKTSPSKKGKTIFGKITRGIAQVAEYSPSKHKALSSNSSTTKKTKSTVGAQNIPLLSSYILIFPQCGSLNPPI
jgi:hypothetical protein